jgi:hypothetical protein
MNLQLTSEDGRAVDLLLDRVATAKGNGNGHGREMVYAVSDPSFGERVTRVQKLLHLLDAMPQVDPPGELPVRTVEFVEKAGRRHTLAPVVPTLLSGNRPVV